jgi:hypothetical protein
MFIVIDVVEVQSATSITVEGFVTTGAGRLAVQSALKPLGAV